MKQSIVPLVQTQRQKQLFTAKILTVHLNQSIVQQWQKQKIKHKTQIQVIDLVIEQNVNISKYKPLSSSSYIKFKRELNHSRKGLIIIQNIDGKKFFKWFLFRYLKVKNVHHVIELDQSRWVKPFIKCLHKKRIEA